MISKAIQNTQHIYALVEECYQYGVEKAVICPGSRCAPLLIGFGNHPKIETISMTDERSAGYVGLGLAQQSGKPVAIVSTSGTAAQNFIPAVTEAYYQQVPLIVLTADRPPEWIDQWDGQTIHQDHMFEPHIKGSFIYTADSLDVSSQAFSLAIEDSKGPIHFNIPISEPFYPNHSDEITFDSVFQKDTPQRMDTIDESIWSEFQSILDSSNQVMILSGQLEPNKKLVRLLDQIDIPIVSDVISNLHGLKRKITSADLIFQTQGSELSPDFLITIGRSILSKNFKLYLRKHKPKVHWHIGLGNIGDPFQSLSKIIRVSPESFFKTFMKKAIQYPDQKTYSNQLLDLQKEVKSKLCAMIEGEHNSYRAVQLILENLSGGSVLHLGNSMPVRIANWIGIDNTSVDVYSNRGTSGIDGVLSTAVGHALAAPEKQHTLIIGDLSFFYDRNALWLNHAFPNNLRIVILNDGGGGIFDMIKGPSDQGDLHPLFTVPHQRSAELTAKEFNLSYMKTHSLQELNSILKIKTSGIIEYFPQNDLNKNIFTKINAINTVDLP